MATGFGGNSTIIHTGAQAVLIDCKNAPYGKALRREATARIGEHAKIVNVVNTHHHADHTGGNHAMASAHQATEPATAPIEIIAHDNCTQRVLAQMNRYISQSKEAASQIPAEKTPTTTVEQVRADALEYYHSVSSLKPTDFAPKVTFAAQREIMLEGMPKALQLVHHGVAHTDNDITVYCSHSNVVIMGDLLFHGLHPFIDRGSGADTRSWRVALEAIAKLCDKDTVVVPGHGALTDVKGVRAQITYFERANDAVAAAIRGGKTRAQMAEIVVPEFKELGNERFAASALQAIFDEHTMRQE